jgi:hypothetical protein
MPLSETTPDSDLLSCLRHYNCGTPWLRAADCSSVAVRVDDVFGHVEPSVNDEHGVTADGVVVIHRHVKDCVPLVDMGELNHVAIEAHHGEGSGQVFREQVANDLHVKKPSDQMRLSDPKSLLLPLAFFTTKLPLAESSIVDSTSS